MKAFTASITDVGRMMNDVNGNPRYRVAFDNGQVLQTKPSAQINHLITNSEYRETPVDVYLDYGVTPGVIIDVKVSWSEVEEGK